jgi:hypothetical protein
MTLASFVLAQEHTAGTTETDRLLDRIGERVQRYYTNLLTVSWNNKVRLEVLKEDLTQKEKPREFEYDVIIRLQEPASKTDLFPFYIRESETLLSVDGKAVKKGQTAKPTDPRPAPMNILTPFLPDAKRFGWTNYTISGVKEFDGQKLLLVEMTSPQRTPPRVEWDDKFRVLGVVHTFQIYGVQYNKGRLWVDPETFDVIRVEGRSDPFEFLPPGNKQTWKYETDYMARFRKMKFENPSQTLVVPEALQFVRTITGSRRSPVVRTAHSFTGFKRFLGDTKIIVTKDTKN